MIQKSLDTNNLNQLNSLSKKCKTLNQLKQIHAQILKSPPPKNPLAVSPILSAAVTNSGNPSFFSYARSIFHSLDHKNVFAFNTMIRAFVQSNSPAKAVSCYSEMLSYGVKANNFTFPPLIKACTLLGPKSAIIGRLAHAHVVKLEFHNDPFVNSALIEFYSSNLRDTKTARHVFDKSPNRDVVLWTTMIDGYGKNEDLERARELFDEMPKRNTVSWSSLMATCSRSNNFREVMSLFSQMQKSGTEPNESVLVSVLTACANLGAVTQGLWVHSYAKRNGLESNPILATALVDMYSKCGLVGPALSVFEQIPEKFRDTESWNAMITGLSINGNATKALELFREMTKTDSRLRPNETTLVAILSACSHARLVHEGLEIFARMEIIYDIKPREEHFACVVDLLGRSGMVEEAERFVEEKMGGVGKWGPQVYGALLGACRVHKKVEIGARVWEKLVEMGVNDSGSDIILYNMYREAGWEEERARTIKKPPGCSLIEVNGVVQEFVAGECDQVRVGSLEPFLRVVNLEDI